MEKKPFLGSVNQLGSKLCQRCLHIGCTVDLESWRAPWIRNKSKTAWRRSRGTSTSDRLSVGGQSGRRSHYQRFHDKCLHLSAIGHVPKSIQLLFRMHSNISDLGTNYRTWPANRWRQVHRDTSEPIASRCFVASRCPRQWENCRPALAMLKRVKEKPQNYSLVTKYAFLLSKHIHKWKWSFARWQ